MNQFSIDRRTGVLLVKFAGAMTIDRLRAFDDEVKALVAAEGPMPAIIDFTEVSSVDVETTAVVDRGNSRRQMAGQPRVFVSTNPLLFGLLRLYGAYQEAIDEKAPLVVTSLAAAFDALSVVDPKFEPVTIPSRPSEGTDSI